MQAFNKYLIIKNSSSEYYTGEVWRDNRGWSFSPTKAIRFTDLKALEIHIENTIKDIEGEKYNYNNVFSDGTYNIEYKFELKEIE